MDLVVDANILFAGLIKESTTATLLFDTRLKLYCPEFILEEFMKYAIVIQQKLKRKPGEFVTIMHQLNDIIMVIPEEMYESFMEEARSISPDEKDAPYFALALKLHCGIWSQDGALEHQERVRIYSTKKIVEYLEE